MRQLKLSIKKKFGTYFRSFRNRYRFFRWIFTIKGTDKKINITDIAKTKQSELPENIDASLNTKANSDISNGTYPNGCHICELEIDSDMVM